MGLGIFIAQSLLERSGAELVFDNLIEGGAHVVIAWKRSNLEAGTRPDAAPPNAAPVRAHQPESPGEIDSDPRPAEQERLKHMNASDRPAASAGLELEPLSLQDLPESERTLLIVDDDAPLCQRLARAMERRGFVVATADSVAAGVAAATAHPPAFAVVDLRLGDGSGLDVVSALRGARPEIRIVVLTGYGNIATAVAAVKAGAIDYLPKPADADAVERALLGRRGRDPGAAGRPDVGRPGALGAHPAHLRAVRPQRFRNRAAPQDAPPHIAAHPQQARAAELEFARDQMQS